MLGLGRELGLSVEDHAFHNVLENLEEIQPPRLRMAEHLQARRLQNSIRFMGA